MRTKETGNVSYTEMLGKAPYDCPNIAIRMKIAKVLTRLPESVREFVLDECVFTSAPGPMFDAITRKAQVPEGALATHEFWLIIMPSQLLGKGEANKFQRAMKKSKEAGKEFARRHSKWWEFVIAHEIAHAYLNHWRSNLSPLDCELEANKLASLWGF